MNIRKQAPPIVDAVNFKLHLKPYEHFTLNNGVPVYTVDAGAQEVMQIEMVFYAGNWYEQRQGIAAAANFMLKAGTTTKTAFQINESFEYYGAHLSRTCYNETAVIALHTLTKHLDVLLPVIHEILTSAEFPESELDIYKQNSKQRLIVNLKKPEFVASRLIDSYVYGEQHPYGKYTHEADIDALQIQELKTFYSKYYQHGQCAIFVSGKLPTNLQTALNQFFGDLPLSKPSMLNSIIPIMPVEQKKYRIVNDETAVQGAIRLAQNFPNRHHPDFKKVIVLNNLFGGFFGSRLMSNIREEKGYTYGIHSYLQSHLQESSWMVSTEAGIDVCEATIAEVYKEMELLRTEPVDDEELLLVQNYMMGSILGDLDGPFHIMAKWKNMILNNLPEDYFYQSVQAIKETNATEMMEMANKYLQPDAFYELVVY